MRLWIPANVLPSVIAIAWDSKHLWYLEAQQVLQPLPDM